MTQPQRWHRRGNLGGEKPVARPSALLAPLFENRRRFGQISAGIGVRQGHGSRNPLRIECERAKTDDASIEQLTQRECTRIVMKLNRRPRKRPGYRTPEECYAP